MQLKWILHVKAYQKLHNCTYKEALTRSKASYQNGGSIKSNYIRRLLAEQTFEIDKIKNPSTHLQNKFIKRVIPSSLKKRIKNKKPAGQILLEEDDDVEPEPETIYEPEQENHIEYDDYHIPELRAFKKAKKLKQLSKKEKEQLQREEERLQREEDEKQKKLELIVGYKALKKQIVAYKSSKSKLDDEYQKELKVISSSKTLRKSKKDLLIQEIINKVNQKEKELKTQFMPIFTFMKANKLELIDDAHKKLRQLIEKLKK